MSDGVNNTVIDSLTEKPPTTPSTPPNGTQAGTQTGGQAGLPGGIDLTTKVKFGDENLTVTDLLQRLSAAEGTAKKVTALEEFVSTVKPFLLQETEDDDEAERVLRASLAKLDGVDEGAVTEAMKRWIQEEAPPATSSHTSQGQRQEERQVSEGDSNIRIELVRRDINGMVENMWTSGEMASLEASVAKPWKDAGNEWPEESRREFRKMAEQQVRQQVVAQLKKRQNETGRDIQLDWIPGLVGGTIQSVAKAMGAVLAAPRTIGGAETVSEFDAILNEKAIPMPTREDMVERRMTPQEARLRTREALTQRIRKMGAEATQNTTTGL